MVIKLYISGISGNKEVKKKQQRVQMILDSKQISYEAIDITEPGKEKDKEFMQQNGKVRESLGKYPLPPQIFNDEDFCGDYEDFDMANEVDELEKFLHIETISKDLENGTKQNADSASLHKESLEPSKSSSYDLYDYHTFRIKFDGVNGLQEEIISTGNPSGENEQVEEVIKSEVNGESEAVPSEISSADNKPEISAEEVPSSATEVPEEEKEAEETKANENAEEKKEDNEAESQENENKEEEEETEDKEEEKVNKESDVENANEEESPHSEKEEEEEEEKEDKHEEKLGTEGKENESEEEKEDRDSDQSEKSQED